MIFFKKKFQQIRESRGLTLKQVANACDVAEATVQKWEKRSNYQPRPDKIPKLAALLHCQESDLAQYGHGISLITKSDLEKYRKRAKISRKQLAEKLGVPEYKIESWENFYEPFDQGYNDKLQEALNLTDSELLGLIGNMVMNPGLEQQNIIRQQRAFLRGESFRKIGNEYVEAFRQKAIERIIMLDIDPAAKNTVLQTIQNL